MHSRAKIRSTKYFASIRKTTYAVPAHRSESELAAAADRALYVSKEQGRGRASVDDGVVVDLRRARSVTPA